MIHEQEKDAGTDHPTGLWSIGAGITLGWDSETGGLAYFDEDWGYQGYTVRQEFYGGAGDTYDESGMRVWRSVNGVRESVLPGVVVYREAYAGAGYDLALLLNEGGFQAGEDGPEFFEVKDHQGNVRALVDGSGEVAQADGYHPYGAMVPLKVAAAAANAPWKWQGKEWDGDVGLFYFGARYWNVELALWLSPDPAGQFANPYTFGGDPVNGVDKDGRCVDGISTIACVAIVGAVIGGTTGAVKAHNRGYGLTDWQSWAYVGGGAIVGGGAAYAGAAGAAWATGAVGLTSGSGLAAATAGGAAGGGLGAGLNTAGFYAMDHGLVGDGQWDWGEFGGNVAIATGSGLLAGGVIGFASYSLSDAVQWKTHETVLEYGESKANPSDGISKRFYRDKMARYVMKQEGLNEGLDWSDFGTKYRLNSSGTGTIEHSWDTGLDNNGKFSAQRFYSSFVHEGGHLSDGRGALSNMYGPAGRMGDAVRSSRINSFMEYSATLHELNNNYYQYWNANTQEWIGKRAAQYWSDALLYGWY